MTAIIDLTQTKQSLFIRFLFLAPVLWTIRVACKPWVKLGGLCGVYALLGVLVFGWTEAAGMAAIGCSVPAWLLFRFYPVAPQCPRLGGARLFVTQHNLRV